MNNDVQLGLLAPNLALLDHGAEAGRYGMAYIDSEVRTLE